ncbi:DUF493 family protein [Xanthovirga aplysinae]|uniref:DUF493 family protein n=1 Tax=Xanthovirga aplysinae TaxID=2529853 RepID=UPI0012BB80DA|nr:DUF493 family protein [Xanthovirga aplysinae]MTI33441.1 DUF493 domain-containing protein [Xanthovirga aplysinae]
MLNQPFSFESFKEKLDLQHKFPEVYTFKFIVPSTQVEEIKSLFLLDRTSKIVEKPSKGGKYISVTAKVLMDSSDDVIRIYKNAQKVEGVISL